MVSCMVTCMANIKAHRYNPPLDWIDWQHEAMRQKLWDKYEAKNLQAKINGSVWLLWSPDDGKRGL